MLSVGDKAPAFTLPDQDGNPVSLEDFAGSRVVVYFYPKDNTPGCTRQACAFRDSYQVYREKNIVPAIHPAFGPGTQSDRGFRCLAGKEAVRQNLYGNSPLHLCAGRNRNRNPCVPQSQTGHQCF